MTFFGLERIPQPLAREPEVPRHGGRLDQRLTEPEQTEPGIRMVRVGPVDESFPVEGAEVDRPSVDQSFSACWGASPTMGRPSTWTVRTPPGSRSPVRWRSAFRVEDKEPFMTVGRMSHHRLQEEQNVRSHSRRVISLIEPVLLGSTTSLSRPIGQVHRLGSSVPHRSLAQGPGRERHEDAGEPRDGWTRGAG